ncbi:PIR protein [Plasmodium vivax]|nr:PIR protein [Plasmodium vivax]
MTEDILDISKLKSEYPFLNEIWKLYKYDEDPIETNDNVQLFSICNEYSIYESKPTNNLKHACKKLLKNWKLLHSTKKEMDEHLEWCNNINNWIYHEINPYILNDDIIYRILVEVQKKFRNMPNEHYCPYTVLNKIHKPQKLNKLRLFNDNFNTFKDILKNKNPDYYCSCINFVKDCINTYRTIQKKYCSNITDININNKVTCEIIKNFDIYYSGFLFNKYTGIQGILPYLSSDDDINIDIDVCPLQKNGKGLNSARGGQSDGFAVSTTPTESSGKTIPTALGTIAGVSSVLGLLYKFSPAGTWMHSGLRGNGRMIHTNLHADGERELLNGGPLTEDLNSYNIGYEVA